ncbi:unnamed protein product, partial [Prorocentrum cordatum]
EALRDPPGGGPVPPAAAAGDVYTADGRFEVLPPNWAGDDVLGQPRRAAPAAEADGGR